MVTYNSINLLHISVNTESVVIDYFVKPSPGCQNEQPWLGFTDSRTGQRVKASLNTKT